MARRMNEKINRTVKLFKKLLIITLYKNKGDNKYYL